ncbi:(2E,6E)-farnesyl diphosphate synthase [Thorsellia kenyensis]|uniref:(2E,6E)-farnesyl diphosphate synthase n=1 Tax=Thorsellia kenyensis TaxID=1549888 RepID=A0ABV6CD05_9GAMM
MNNSSVSTIKQRFESALQITQERFHLFTAHQFNLIESANEYPQSLIEAMRYGLLLGGKRIRPHLLYTIGELFGVNASSLNYMALALESIHAYSLIHDDLPAMDDDALRRGNPTCHVKFGEANAILAGDALQTFAFEILSRPLEDVDASKQLKILHYLAKSSGLMGMCGGQVLDLESENKSITFTDLKNIHRLKTGALIKAAAMIPVIASRFDSPLVLSVIEKYAEAIGLAFQIQDDILDVIGDTKTLGKFAGADEALGKNTYPSLIGLDEAKKMAHELIEEANKQISFLAQEKLFHSEEKLMFLKDLNHFIITRMY